MSTDQLMRKMVVCGQVKRYYRKSGKQSFADGDSPALFSARSEKEGAPRQQLPFGSLIDKSMLMDIANTFRINDPDHFFPNGSIANNINLKRRTTLLQATAQFDNIPNSFSFN